MRIRTRSIVIMTFQGMTQVSQLLIGIILVRLISKEMLGSYRQIRTNNSKATPRIPPLWDGKAAERIAEIIASLV